MFLRFGRQEEVPRHSCHRVQHRLIVDTAPRKLRLHHALSFLCKR
jgi:hypothetical protein